MNIGFYAAKQGVMNMQKGMDITSNNIANVQTNGYKVLRGSFSDLIYTSRKTNEKVDTGHGVKLDKTDLMWEQSALKETGGALDFATTSEGAFAFKTEDGTIKYSKDGALYITKDDNGWRLVNEMGDSALDYEKNEIYVNFNEDTTVNNAEVLEKLGVFRFENPYGLEADGNNYYLATASSGEAIADEVLEKRSGYLEASGVNLADEMVKVIQYQRAFTFNTKMITAQDEMENAANNLR